MSVGLSLSFNCFPALPSFWKGQQIASCLRLQVHRPPDKAQSRERSHKEQNAPTQDFLSEVNTV